MTYDALDTALANIHPESMARAEAFEVISRHLLSGQVAARFAGYRGIAHADVVQEVLFALFRRTTPITANSARAYLNAATRNAYNLAAKKLREQRQREQLCGDDMRELQERDMTSSRESSISEEHALVELSNGLPRHVDVMFSTNIDQAMLEHFITNIVPLLANHTQEAGEKFVRERVAISTGATTPMAICIEMAGSASASPTALRRARARFNQAASRYRRRFADILSRGDLSEVTGLLEEEVSFLTRWASEMAIV